MKAVRVKILVRSAQDQRPGKVWIDRGPHRIARVAVIRRVVGKLRRKGQSRLQRLNAAYLPIADQPVEPFAPGAKGQSYVALSTAAWQMSKDALP